MHFERIKTPGIAHVTYFLGAKGEAVVVDRRRDVDEYLKIARKNNPRIKPLLDAGDYGKSTLPNATRTAPWPWIGAMATALALGALVPNASPMSVPTPND